ncbi:MAG: glutamate-cysteine ligase family protein [Actinomycetota bacterium]
MTVTGTTVSPAALVGAVESLFSGDDSWAPGDLPTVGLELELVPLRPTGGRPAPVTVAEMEPLLASLAGVTFEPGGQVELNPPPQPTVTAAVAVLGTLAAETARRLAAAGIELVATGLNPWHTLDELPLQLTTERYVAMDRHFASIGPAGRAFMRQSASTQLCIGLAPGAAGQQQWRAANLLAPVLAAVFANSPRYEGRLLATAGGRTAICRLADPDRAGHGRFPAPGNQVAAYVALAAGARPLGPGFSAPGAEARHLSTLFPPVRPRGTYLEVRSVDSLPLHEVRTAASLGAVLLGDPQARSLVSGRLATEFPGPCEMWDLAAGPGIRHRALRRAALVAVEAAHVAVDRLGPYLPPGTADDLEALARRVAAERTPGDTPAAALAPAPA